MTDWLDALKAECAKSSQAKVAKELGYSAATISLVLKGKYAGDLKTVERKFKGCFLNASLICPVMGEMSVDKCVCYRRMKFSAVNPQRIALYKACRNGCPHFKTGD